VVRPTGRTRRPAPSASTPVEPEPATGAEPVSETEPGEQGEPGGQVQPAEPDGSDGFLGPLEASQPVIIRQVPDWLNWAPAGVLGAGALVMAVLLIVFSHGVWWGPDPGQVPAAKSPAVVREQVLAAAKTCVATTNTYKYTDLDGYEKQALACATGEFAGQLKQTIDTLLKVNAPRLKSSQTAQINRGGIEAISPDGRQWTILLFGQLSVTNAGNQHPRTDPFAAQVRMQRVHGKWLISALTTVSTPLS
jgi:hypothetical protein